VGPSVGRVGLPCCLSEETRSRKEANHNKERGKEKAKLLKKRNLLTLIRKPTRQHHNYNVQWLQERKGGSISREKGSVGTKGGISGYSSHVGSREGTKGTFFAGTKSKEKKNDSKDNFCGMLGFLALRQLLYPEKKQYSICEAKDLGWRRDNCKTFLWNRPPLNTLRRSRRMITMWIVSPMDGHLFRRTQKVNQARGMTGRT